MPRVVKLLAPIGLSVAVSLSVLLCSGAPGTGPRQARAAAARPNFLFVLTDDMRKDDLAYMPKTRNLLSKNGMSFKNALVTSPLCSPSRASILRGQYPHNTGVWTNSPNDPAGGEPAFRANKDDQDNLATRLHDAGYRTALIGKYINGYQGTDVPPGWDRFFALEDFQKYFDYDVNDQGTIKHYGTAPSDYATDVISDHANAFVSDSVAQGSPFFAYVATNAPHAPSIPAPRDKGTFANTRWSRAPSFNEADVSDKPPWIQELPTFDATGISAIDSRHEKRVESLQAVDDMVARLLTTLKNDGQLGNTYVFFTSDNGAFYGEHRIPAGKARPYEEAYRVPLLVRGPTVPSGASVNRLALNTDYAPTMLDLAGAPAAPYFDGRSLAPLLGGTAPSSWRTAALIEGHSSNESKGMPDDEGIRTAGRSYVEYATGERELYDLAKDPYELDNVYDPAAKPAGLASRLRALETCSANATLPEVTCRAAEGG